MSKILTCRPAAPSDYDVYVKMVPELGVDDPILPREQWVGALLPGTLVFEEGAEVVGYAWVVRMGELAYVRHIVVAPSARGRGIGKGAMLAIASRMREAGCVEWSLNVKMDNTPAVRLYESVGLSKAYESTPMRLPWRCVSDLPADLTTIARVLEPRDDAAVEKAFGLPNNRIGELRAREGWVFLRVEERTTPDDLSMGVACFWPKLPGAFPFRVKYPSHARCLLEAMQEYAKPEFDYVGVVVEDDPGLKSVMLKAGAEVRMELMHMRGKIPEGT